MAISPSISDVFPEDIPIGCMFVHDVELEFLCGQQDFADFTSYIPHQQFGHPFSIILSKAIYNNNNQLQARSPGSIHSILHQRASTS